jgi:retron-type reverse transcriptase
VKDKKNKKDVQIFERNLMENLLDLHFCLKTKDYKHSGYHAFKISDPKPRNINKATVRDRLLHHAIHRVLYPYFETKFIYDSYSCRVNKGTHKAINRFRYFCRKVSKNNTHSCWILKCDIKKFVASIDHKILIDVLSRSNLDNDTLELLQNIIDSFSTIWTSDVQVGLPLGNLTSQLLVNVYMNEFDQFVKHKLKVKYYIRYADDFVVLSEDKEYSQKILKQMKEFLEAKLKLNLHPDKVFIKTIASGVDFLGWVHFPKYRVLRTATKRRMFRNIKDNKKLNTIPSYLGMLGHGDGYKLQQKILKGAF